MSVSSFKRYLADMHQRAPDTGVSTRLASLNPSLMEDLLRFEQNGRSADLLEVFAACMRHARALTVHLQYHDKVLPLTLFPRERLVHCPVDLQELAAGQPAELPVLEVEAAVLRPLGDPETARVGEAHLYAPLQPLLWMFALRGVRAELLPEVAGTAVYRISPAFEVLLVPKGPLRDLLRHMRRNVTSLREIAAWPGLDAELAARLVNALYLQAALMVSRSHPGALSIPG